MALASHWLTAGLGYFHSEFISNQPCGNQFPQSVALLWQCRNTSPVVKCPTEIADEIKAPFDDGRSRTALEQVCVAQLMCSFLWSIYGVKVCSC